MGKPKFVNTDTPVRPSWQTACFLRCAGIMGLWLLSSCFLSGAYAQNSHAIRISGKPASNLCNGENLDQVLLDEAGRIMPELQGSKDLSQFRCEKYVLERLYERTGAVAIAKFPNEDPEPAIPSLDYRRQEYRASQLHLCLMEKVYDQLGCPELECSLLFLSNRYTRFAKEYVQQLRTAVGQSIGKPEANQPKADTPQSLDRDIGIAEARAIAYGDLCKRHQERAIDATVAARSLTDRPRRPLATQVSLLHGSSIALFSASALALIASIIVHSQDGKVVDSSVCGGVPGDCHIVLTKYFAAGYGISAALLIPGIVTLGFWKERNRVLHSENYPDH